MPDEFDNADLFLGFRLPSKLIRRVRKKGAFKNALETGL